MTETHPEEQLRHTSLAVQARKLICDSFLIESDNGESLTTYYRGFYLQMSFSSVHPLIVFCLARRIWDTESPRQLEAVNELNLQSILGSHTINPGAGCYAYRAVHWLDTEFTKERLFELADRFCAEAQRGYQRLWV